MQVGDSLEEFLLSATPDPKLRQIMMSLSEAIRTIAFKVCSTILEFALVHGPECIASSLGVGKGKNAAYDKAAIKSHI